MHMQWGHLGFRSEVATNWLRDFEEVILPLEPPFLHEMKGLDHVILIFDDS